MWLPHHNDDQDHEQEGKKSWAPTTTWLLHHNTWLILLMPTQNESINMKEKNYGHFLPLHHDHDWCCLITNAYTKLNHEHEHDQEKFWALASVWFPHHDDDPMLLNVYTKWKSRLATNMIKKKMTMDYCL
jgi:hypothetical protein